MKMEQYKAVLDGAVVSDATTRKVLRAIQTFEPSVSPKVKRRHGYAIAAAACVVVLLALLSLPLFFGKWSISTEGQGGASTTTPTTVPTVTSTTDPLDGTGGDENACTVHQFHYHAIDGNLIEYVGQEKMDEYSELYECREDFNIVSFVNYFHLTREEFIQVMEWGDILDQTADQQSIVIGATAPYTYREFVDAVFGDDEELAERIFSAEIFDQQLRDNK